MAAIWVKQQHLNDAIILNSHKRVADATIANVFVIQDGKVKTPMLDEGGINGIMRRHLLLTLPNIGIEVSETQISTDDLLAADELFLTNSIYGIRWVKQLKEKEYGNELTKLIYKKGVKG